MTPAQIEEITQLRSRKVSPKQIARKLGLRSAEVSAIIKQQFEVGNIQKQLPELKSVLMNDGAIQHLFNSNDDDRGLTQVIVLRIDEKKQYWVSSYLVDCWCLGVKNALGPRRMTRKQYDEFLYETEDKFGQKLREITLKQAQSVVFGALDYAKGLGFEPHKDFRRSRSHLGPRPDTLIDLEFGKDGKPFFICGPYDDSVKVIETLRESVGEENFHYIAKIASIGSPDDFF